MFCPKSLPSCTCTCEAHLWYNPQAFSESNEFRCKSKQCWSFRYKKQIETTSLSIWTASTWEILNEGHFVEDSFIPHYFSKRLSVTSRLSWTQFKAYPRNKVQRLWKQQQQQQQQQQHQQQEQQQQQQQQEEQQQQQQTTTRIPGPVFPSLQLPIVPAFVSNFSYQQRLEVNQT